jgi:hypothetical protein
MTIKFYFRKSWNHSSWNHLLWSLSLRGFWWTSSSSFIFGGKVLHNCPSSRVCFHRILLWTRVSLLEKEDSYSVMSPESHRSHVRVRQKHENIHSASWFEGNSYPKCKVMLSLKKDTRPRFSLKPCNHTSWQDITIIIQQWIKPWLPTLLI